ncbi:MAG: ATP-binding protein [Actinomycetota bacterium]
MVLKEHSATLGHFGVLFLDELTLYRRDVLESLRGPLEDAAVTIARSGGAITYPCRFSLVAAMNPCPCGYLGDGARPCSCSAHQIELYLSRLSGPFRDRFDIRCDVARVSKDELLGPPDGPASGEIRARVEAARTLQAARYGSALRTNASAPRAAVEAAGITAEARSLLSDAIESRRLTGRGVDRAVRVARTIADLAGREAVGAEDMSSALSLRLLDPKEEAAA